MNLVCKKLVILLAFLVTLLISFGGTAQAHPGLNLLEDCDLLLKKEENPELSCKVFLSILYSQNIANGIDSNKNKNFESDELKLWLTENYTRKIILKIDNQAQEIDLKEYDISKYNEFVTTPETGGISFSFKIKNNFDTSFFKKSHVVELVNNSTIDSSAAKTFTLNLSSEFYIDISNYNLDAPNTLPIIPNEAIEGDNTIQPSTSPAPVKTQENSNNEGLFTKLRKYLESSATSSPEKPSPFLTRFSSYLNEISFGGFLILLLIALLAGSAHALTPGHGKAFISAVLIQDAAGGVKKSLMLGIAMTIAHTISVFILGILYILIDKSQIFGDFIKNNQPFIKAFTLISYFLIIIIGLRLLLQRIKEARLNKHDKKAGAEYKKKIIVSNASFKNILLNGISGGIAPCLEALSILIIAITRDHAVLGGLIVIAFSIGMAFTLILFGMIIVKSKNKAQSYKKNARIFEFLPILSSIFIIILGMYLLLSTINK